MGSAGVIDEIAVAGDARGLPCCGGMREVGLEATGSLDSALPGVRHPAQLPLLDAILRLAHRHGRGRYLLYSNIDIALQHDCYSQLVSLLQRQPDVPISAVREEFEFAEPTFSLADAAARRGLGLPHPGHDLWAFPRAWVPDLALGPVALGVSLVATGLNQALIAALLHCC